MKLIDLYIQEVTRRLPKKMRKDIALELRSTIEDMLPYIYSENDVKQELEKLGDPISLAAQYKDEPMHLIGPKFYDMYKSVLKMVLLIASVVTIIFFLLEKVESLTGNEVLPLFIVSIFGEAIWVVIDTAIQSFFWVTIVFIILERTIAPTIHTPLTLSGEKWTPSDLEKISYLPHYKAIKKNEIFFSFLWTVILVTLYFNSTRLIGIYESSNDQQGLQFKLPVFDNDILISYWPLVVFYIVLDLLLTIYKMKTKMSTYKLAISNTIVHLAGTISLLIIVNTPGILNIDFLTYMASIFDQSFEHTRILMTRITWGIVVSLVAISMIDIITSFLKARASNE
ncbi:hypothetical protein [Sporosarcina sp. G11-34]|uniref:hypothetical protein n=1 Tax=Sporosarcina sp. G11-34 TaxID=2849605 RepID=UPI0022A919C2|nr:hypothetical protein [Sporosarcina sp. G11-34]MCZ2257899.1 hypothetical protein [Sporosarcina sp. G11-34]